MSNVWQITLNYVIDIFWYLHTAVQVCITLYSLYEFTIFIPPVVFDRYYSVRIRFVVFHCDDRLSMLCILLAAIGVFGMSFGMAMACVSSSRILHADLLGSIFRAPMSFFDTTPLGRIVNRLSRDVDTIDVNIPMTIRIWLGTFSGVFTTICVIAYSTPIFLAVVVPLGIFYYFIQVIYVSFLSLEMISPSLADRFTADLNNSVLYCL